MWRALIAAGVPADEIDGPPTSALAAECEQQGLKVSCLSLGTASQEVKSEIAELATLLKEMIRPAVKPTAPPVEEEEEEDRETDSEEDEETLIDVRSPSYVAAVRKGKAKSKGKGKNKDRRSQKTDLLS